jgi:2-polyprenyl-3-methyl-5-hydroxy-6-metoxy-1,4-benzoquinol methylase
MVNTYDSPYWDSNVYGLAVRLLTRATERAGLHLDIGCGFGRMAEPLCAATGAVYAGFDADEDGLNSLRERGFEARRIDLREISEAEAIIKTAMAGRALRSISIINVLEHVPEPGELLAMLRRIAGAENCPLVIAVPNVTHRDIGTKLAFGRWDVTVAGVLDQTHLQFFNRARLNDIAASAGWHNSDVQDWIRPDGDQHFPDGHPALAEGSLLGQFLRSVTEPAHDDARVYEFIGAYMPGEARPPAPLPRNAEEPQEPRPFLTVVTRTQGKRVPELTEALLCLMAQSCQDFELLILGHRLTDETLPLVEQVIASLPESLRARTRLIRVEEGNRTTPLNVGFAAARGQYACILDDDDIVLGHWVETWRDLAKENFGRVLRANVARQDFTTVETAHTGHRGAAAESGMKLYPSEFNLIAHLVGNHTPPLGMAFPVAAFEELKIHFDEALTTTEDWDFFLRTGLICGFASSPEVVAIYRWWKNLENSASDHPQEEWLDNQLRIYKKLDEMPVLLPPGMIAQLRKLMTYTAAPPPPALYMTQPDDKVERDFWRRQIAMQLNSTSWRVTAPIRVVRRLIGRTTPFPALDGLDAVQLRQVSIDIRNSTSWRISLPLRALKERMEASRR